MFDPVRGRLSGWTFSVGSGEPTAIHLEPGGFHNLAQPGTFRLAPQDFRLSELKKDYQAMRDMFLAEPPSFESVITSISELEHKMNGNRRREFELRISQSGVA